MAPEYECDGRVEPGHDELETPERLERRARLKDLWNG
jgi:hypothetical protein